MNHFYVGLSTAYMRSGAMATSTFTAYKQSLDEARAAGLSDMLARCPVAEGYYGHRSDAVEQDHIVYRAPLSLAVAVDTALKALWSDRLSKEQERALADLLAAQERLAADLGVRPEDLPALARILGAAGATKTTGGQSER